LLNGIGDPMGERLIDNLARIVGHLGGPSAEGAPETVDRRTLGHELGERHVADGLLGGRAMKHQGHRLRLLWAQRSQHLGRPPRRDADSRPRCAWEVLGHQPTEVFAAPNPQSRARWRINAPIMARRKERFA
jgi:hypothetical protein